MTPAEEALIARLGVSLLLGAAWLIAISVLHGMFILLFAISTHTLFRRGFPSSTSWIMFGVTVFCFLVATLHWSAQISSLAIVIRSAMINHLDPVTTNQKAQTANIISVWTQFLPVVSDAVVVWRAWALFWDQWWIMILPTLLLLATTAMTFAFLGYTILFSVMGSREISDSTYLLVSDIYTSRISLSLATNVVATGLIGWKLWTHRSIVVKNLGLKPRVSPGQRILIFLVESGVLYCALQVVNVALSLAPNETVISSDSATSYASQVLFAIYAEVSAMYPTIVIVMVNTQRSLVDTYGFTSVFKDKQQSDSKLDVESRPITAGHLSFAVDRTRSDVDTYMHSDTVQFSDKPSSSVTKFIEAREENPNQLRTAPF